MRLCVIKDFMLFLHSKRVVYEQKSVFTEKMRKPSFLLVLTGGQFAYRRKDGVLIVPIGCLKN